MLTQDFSGFSPLLFSCCCLYSVYALLIALLLDLSTLLSFHFLPHSKCNLLLATAFFKDFYFLWCSMISFTSSKVYARKASLFSMYSTYDIIFIAYQNHHHMINNMRKQNVSTFSGFTRPILRDSWSSW